MRRKGEVVQTTHSAVMRKGDGRRFHQGWVARERGRDGRSCGEDRMM